MQDTRMSESPLGCLIVEAGATADVEGCCLEGSSLGPGSLVKGMGSNASLSGCVLTGGDKIVWGGIA